MSTYQAAIDMYNDGDCEVLKKYRKDKNNVEEYRGFSFCRICDFTNGSREFKYKGFVWPDGFRHYIEEHNVKPSDEFIEMINKIDINYLLKSSCLKLDEEDIDFCDIYDATFDETEEDLIDNIRDD